MILAIAFLYTPPPPVPFPEQFQGAWDKNIYACSQAVTPSRMAITNSHFLQGEFRGYSTGFSRLNAKVIISNMLSWRSKKEFQSIERLELSEDGETLFVQSYQIKNRKETATAQIFVRCPNQEKAMEQFQ